jgi:lipoate-protein ligase A
MAAAATMQGSPDLSVLLSQVKMLESDRERLTRELDEARKKIEEEHRRLEEVNSKMGRLTEGKRAEMQQAFDTVIKKWLADSVQDEKVRQEFQTGMARLVENTAEDSGVWQVRASL